MAYRDCHDAFEHLYKDWIETPGTTIRDLIASVWNAGVEWSALNAKATWDERNGATVDQESIRAGKLQTPVDSFSDF